MIRIKCYPCLCDSTAGAEKQEHFNTAISWNSNVKRVRLIKSFFIINFAKIVYLHQKLYQNIEFFGYPYNIVCTSYKESYLEAFMYSEKTRLLKVNKS